MRKKKRGFTLIELMVVVTIIVVLVSILLPAASRAKQAAGRVKCLSNMRQLGVACTSYTMENEGQLPYCNWSANGNIDDPNCYGHGWLFTSVKFRAYPASTDLNGPWSAPLHPPEDGAMTGLLWPYLRSLEVYHCPLDSSATNNLVGTEWMTSYLYNGGQCGYGAVGNGSKVSIPGARITLIRSPSEDVMFWEALEQQYKGQVNTAVIYAWNDGSSFPAEEVLADRHFSGANVSCYDGHAEWWDPATWSHWVNDPGPNRLWNSPYSPNGH